MRATQASPLRKRLSDKETFSVISVLNILATPTGWAKWWLPADYSEHGHAIDSLFTWIFWITMITFVLVQVTLIVFMVKYRSRKDVKKAKFTHGNARLEMCWTIA